MLSASDFRGDWLRVTPTTELSLLALSSAAKTLCLRAAAVRGEASAAFTKSALVALRRVEATARELRDECFRLDELAETRSVRVAFDLA
jgi:hypothetical protein